VCSVPIEDYHLCDERLLEKVVIPFLVESDRAAVPVVVHCSGGSGRTGHVLAAWLVRHRELSVDQALAAVVATGRNPSLVKRWKTGMQLKISFGDSSGVPCSRLRSKSGLLVPGPGRTAPRWPAGRRVRPSLSYSPAFTSRCC